jgi:hypothetical protein
LVFELWWDIEWRSPFQPDMYHDEREKNCEIYLEKKEGYLGSIHLYGRTKYGSD